MCGRFSLRLEHQEIQAVQGYNLHINQWVDQDRFVPRYNVAPRSQAPVIRRSSGNASETGEGSSSASSSSQLIMQTMKWGLVPHWSKYEDKTLNTMNARSENLIAGGGMWNSIKGRKRCVVVCQGYYEWLTKGKEKIPHFTKPKTGKLMLLAGMYDSVVLEDQTDTLWSFTIVTTAASSEFSWLHDRQPVILSNQQDLELWLDTEQRWSEDLVKIVSRAHTKDSPLECYQVPKEVGKVGAESSSFILPIAARKDGIQAMFSKQKQAKETKATTTTGKPSSSTPTKRKRTGSISSSASKRKEAAKNEESDSDEIEILDGPPPLAKKASLPPLFVLLS